MTLTIGEIEWSVKDYGGTAPTKCVVLLTDEGDKDLTFIEQKRKQKWIRTPPFVKFDLHSYFVTQESTLSCRILNLDFEEQIDSWAKKGFTFPPFRFFTPFKTNWNTIIWEQWRI